MQMPNRKVASGLTLGGAIAILAALGLEQFDIELGDVGIAALSVVITSIVGYMVPEKKA